MMLTALSSTRGRVWNRQCGCQFFLRWQHSVRVIITDTMDSHHSAGKVLNVSAGYARNYLIPQKKALYAIPENFQRLGIKDPAIETEEERQMRLAKEAADAANLDLIAANVLEKYLKNKTLRIWRNVDPRTQAIYPNMVDANAIRDKLSRQLKIDLEDDQEQIHIREEPINVEGMPEEEVTAVLDEIDTSSPCKVQLRQLGMYVAKISVKGGYSVPLKFTITKR